MFGDSLTEYYRLVNLTHGLTALCAKFSLLIALYLVETGNEKPGQKLLLLAFAVHFLIALFIALGTGGWVIVLVLASLAMLALSGHALLKVPYRLKVLPEFEPWRMIALAGLAAAFLFPFWKNPSLIRGAIFSPMGPLPQQTLMVLLIILAVSGTDGPRLLARVAVPVAALLALLDIVAGNTILGMLMLLIVVPASYQVFLAGKTASAGETEPAEPAGGLFDRPRPATRRAEAPPVKDDPDEQRPKKKWDIR